MESEIAAEMWFNTYEEEPDMINTAYEGVKGLIA